MMRFGRDVHASLLASLTGRDERVLWHGRPVGIRWTRILPVADAIGRPAKRALTPILLALIGWTVAALIVEAVPSPGVVGWYVAFGGAGLLAALPAVARAFVGETIYAVTDERVLSFSEHGSDGMRSRDLASLERVDIEELRPDGVGTLRFTPMRLETRTYGTGTDRREVTLRVPDETNDGLVRPAPVFANVADVVRVGEIVRAARAERRGERRGERRSAH